MKKSINMNFENLFIYEMANNHQGSVEHGKKIIDEMSKISKKHKINAAVKFQYRQLDSFIHPDFRNDLKAKHISRFLSTELSKNDFLELINYTKSKDMLTVVTPFDEASVDVILKHKVDIIKIASCSSSDWPLLTKISKAKKPVIASTGGLNYDQIDNLYSFLLPKVPQLALLHCVGIYPTPNKDLNINAVSSFIKRYPDVTIGYSGHENPDDVTPIISAISKGAKIFERHIGVVTDTITLNGYAMNPKQVNKWVEAANRTIEGLGFDKVYNKAESDSMLSLKRGVVANKKIKKGNIIKEEDIYYAMPCNEGQLDSGQFGKIRCEYKASKDYSKNEALYEKFELDSYHKIRTIVHRAQAILRRNKLIFNNETSAEISHHYGIENFEKFGIFIVNVINLEYCKKIIIVFPGQVHPEQHHIKKQETFHVLEGSLDVTLNGIKQTLVSGDIATVDRGVKHIFSSEKGCVIEEISSTHFRNDSFYTDEKINKMDPLARKTVIDKFYV